jgi:hypothetical protein
VAAACIAAALGCSAAACSSGSANHAAPTSGAPHPSATDAHGARGAITVAGRATLDGRPLDAQFLGAVVVDHHLVTPCNVTIPTVVGGRFSISVYDASTSAGCGADGAHIVLWTYEGSTQLFATRAINWSTRESADVAVAFSTAHPAGAAPSLFELNGHVYRADGSKVPAGARVEAYIGSTLCGVASVRSGLFDGYILHVVEPDSIPLCAVGRPITFRVDGVRAKESIANGGKPPRAFDLTTIQ